MLLIKNFILENIDSMFTYYIIPCPLINKTFCSSVFELLQVLAIQFYVALTWGRNRKSGKAYLHDKYDHRKLLWRKIYGTICNNTVITPRV
jgi:hypothetical protein